MPATDRPRLLARQRELLERHRDRWEDAFRGLISNCEYHNGFAERVTLSVDELVHGLADLVHHTPVVRVRLRDLNANTVAAAAHVQALARVRELDLNRAPLAPEVFRALIGSPHLTRLRSLQLARTGLGDNGVRALVASNVFGRLEYLNLSHTNLTVVGLIALVGAIRNRTTALRVLVLRGAPRLPPGSVLPLPQAVPIGVRQALEAQIGLELGKPVNLLARLHAERAGLSADFRRWVELLRTRGPRELPRAVTALGLPDPLRHAFVRVCQRRVVWRANRLGFVPPEEDSGSENLLRLLRLLFEMADERDERALVDHFLDLYMRYERGDLPEDGKTR
ncbi:hypothetical protein [Frigoriglobus tundricola]|uniref:Uncharacterized protein n=1 Tax=Frigoriglobus tundricola TaxID=2774151 RepID=A0A6M5Z2V6_9BACT|nr:hypothetical protein [Frigoriglobus tundricola]QJX00760.1 hypothetical protein FTUN_8392 [Frigoriglobus tundricola]